jgi:hypothetical protein
MAKAIQLSQTGRNIATFFEEQNAWLIFVIICLGYGATQYIQDTMILTKEVYYNTLGEQLTIERIDAMLENQAEWKFVNYLLIPLILIIQICLVALCLNCGTILMNHKIQFKTLFKLVLKASIVFLINKLVFTLILLFSKVQVADDLILINKFALSGFATTINIPKWLMYALSNINIFEVTFWLLLAFGISGLLKQSFKTSFSFVAATYGVGLFIWIVFIIFLQLNLM